MSKEALSLLASYFQKQLEILENIFQEIKPLRPLDKNETVRAEYLLHNPYCAIEDLFLEVARTFENRGRTRPDSIGTFLRGYRSILRVSASVLFLKGAIPFWMNSDDSATSFGMLMITTLNRSGWSICKKRYSLSGSLPKRI